MSDAEMTQGEAEMTPADAAATCCATFVDTWIRLGVTHACIAPGSRSTPMALALAARSELSLSIHHDERSAAFAALGVGLASGQPAIVLTTSGTAAVHLHAAVVEADLARVPLLALTADRPPELQGVGAPQTIDQRELYGRAVRAYIDAGVPEATSRDEWRSTAARAFGSCLVPAPGPVQLNLPFREPLLGNVRALPPVGGELHGRAVDATDLPIAPDTVDQLVRLVSGRRGVVVAGYGIDDPVAVHRLAAVLGWPVLADARSGARLEGSPAIAHADALLRVDEWAATHQPEVVVRVGDPWASKVVTQWLAATPELVIVDRHAVWIEPDRRPTLRMHTTATMLAATMAPLVSPVGEQWLQSWIRAEEMAEQAVSAALGGDAPLSEPLIASIVAQHSLDYSAVVAASSMPVRDIEWYGGRRDRITHYANRGANGIDGVVSTAIGVALTGRRVIALVGDIAFLHDSSAMIALARRQIDLTIVVIDNDGGGIFSFLAQADALDRERFELLFGTPHGTDIAAVARAHRIDAVDVDTAEEFSVAFMKATDASGVHVVVARTDRDENVAVHRRIHDTVARAVATQHDLGAE
ncbi:MAG TPA: 2-succinyl-5-enolpyruvyl-6-hydroxy-3-cyclohexene-1-carboxylic-acid synthase [Acidimicrobiales bacterium]|nr:2-succinyl-5-enolpyruvyl-6-hydroxy-3-cyclohexene-1-carboxylic-acid synthase [Acidimicrobiales bacterium]